MATLPLSDIVVAIVPMLRLSGGRGTLGGFVLRGSNLRVRRARVRLESKCIDDPRYTTVRRGW